MRFWWNWSRINMFLGNSGHGWQIGDATNRHYNESHIKQIGNALNRKCSKPQHYTDSKIQQMENATKRKCNASCLEYEMQRIDHCANRNTTIWTRNERDVQRIEMQRIEHTTNMQYKKKCRVVGTQIDQSWNHQNFWWGRAALWKLTQKERWDFGITENTAMTKQTWKKQSGHTFNVMATQGFHDVIGFTFADNFWQTMSLVSSTGGSHCTCCWSSTSKQLVVSSLRSNGNSEIECGNVRNWFYDRQVSNTITESQNVIVFPYQLKVGIGIVIVCSLTPTLIKRLFLCCAWFHFGSAPTPILFHFDFTSTQFDFTSISVRCHFGFISIHKGKKGTRPGAQSETGRIARRKRKGGRASSRGIPLKEKNALLPEEEDLMDEDTLLNEEENFLLSLISWDHAVLFVCCKRGRSSRNQKFNIPNPKFQIQHYSEHEFRKRNFLETWALETWIWETWRQLGCRQFSIEWRRAVNRQPGPHARNS